MFPLDGEAVIWSGFPHDVMPWGALGGGWIADVRAGQQTTRDIAQTLIDRGYGRASIAVVGFGAARPRGLTVNVQHRQFPGTQERPPGARSRVACREEQRGGKEGGRTGG